ncbi:MAG: hypothetical protein O2974_11450 [Chloroflexi bacterium]|nr:hypothetical protein [Chloroflexota bacterium]
MPAAGYRKRETLRINELINLKLMSDMSVSVDAMYFIIRADTEIRNLLEQNKTELPTKGTIANYISKEKTRIKRSGSDRPWSVLASSDPKNKDFISASDLPLILKMWSIRLAHGQYLTLRQARWISRLRYLLNLDESEESNDQALNNLFYFAAMYSSREITVGEKNDSNAKSVDSSDLDAVIFTLFSSIKNDSLHDAKRVAYEAGLGLGIFTLPLGNPAQPDEWLVASERTARIVADIKSLSMKAYRLIHLIDNSSSSVLFLVLELLFKRPRWDSESEDSRRSVVEKVVDAVVLKDWKSVATLAGIWIEGFNDEFLESIQKEEDVDE